MGGGLVMHILTEGETVCQNARELILQPQSEIPLVRAFLQEHHYETDREEMVLEDGKYYPMMRVRYASHAFSAFEDSADILQGAVDAAQDSATVSQELALRYGALLLAGRHPVLFSYLKKEQQTYRAIRANLEQSLPSEKNKARIHQVDEIIRYNKEALRFFADA
jgi:tRNA (adenine22-N1)-methyltransferase